MAAALVAGRAAALGPAVNPGNPSPASTSNPPSPPDFLHEEQRLQGYRSLNLLNASGDPTMMRSGRYHYIARQCIPAPKANWVRVVIDAENWGFCVNVQQINSELFKSSKGTRWKVPGSPMG